MRPDAVVDVALKKLGRKTTVVAGWSNSLILFSTRLLPSSWNATIFGLVIGGILMDVRTSAQAQLVKGAGSNEQDRQETE
jgi:hypothetical protein